MGREKPESPRGSRGERGIISITCFQGRKAVADLPQSPQSLTASSIIPPHLIDTVEAKIKPTRSMSDMRMSKWPVVPWLSDYP
jgi:hypothetical protein